MSFMLGSIVDSDGENSSDNDLKALGKIRIEDAEAQEIIRELVKEFEEYGKKEGKLENENALSNEERQDSSDVEEAIELPEDEKPKGNYTLTQKMLGLLREYCEKFIEGDVPDERTRVPYLMEKRRKKLMMEALLNMLRRLSLSGKEKSLKDLLDEQIASLQKALETEKDPEVRKALQERLGVLMQLRMNLSQMKDMGPAARMAMLLMQCALAEGYIGASRHKNGFTQEGGMRLSRGMGKVMDVGNVDYRGLKEGASMAASYCAHLAERTLTRSSLEGAAIGALARSLSLLDGAALLKQDKLLVAGQAVDGAVSGLHPDGMLLARLVRAANGVINSITRAVTDAMHGGRGTSAKAADASARGARTLRNFSQGREQGNMGNRRSAQDRGDPNMGRPRSASAGMDFHVKSNVHCKVDGERVERTECKETRGVSYYVQDYGTYLVRSVVYTCQSITEKVSGLLKQDSPSTELSGVSIERVQQNQVFVGTQVISR